MEQEIQKLEAELAALRPAALDGNLSDRLARAMEGRLTGLDPEQQHLERRLAVLEPARLKGATMAALLARVERLPFPGESGAQKVVPFPRAERSGGEVRRRRRPWAAAAAVALAGGLSAFFLTPGGEDSPSLAASPGVGNRGGTPTADPAAFSPASFESGVSQTHDLGRMWSGGERAMRVVKVTYKDRVVWLNENGEEVVTEVPRVEYLVVPEQVD